MKIAIYLDEVNQAIDNSMHWSVMQHIGKELAKKVEVIFIDPIKLGSKESLSRIKKQNYDILFTYNKTGINLIEDSTGENLMSLLEVPQISWLVEHPVTFYDGYKKTNSPNRNYIFPNSTHNIFAEKMGLQGRYSNLLFASNEKKIIKNFKDRSFDICIAAQWRGAANTNAFWESMTGFEKKFFEEINQLQNTKDGNDVFQAFLVVADYYKIPEENINYFAPALKALYWYARKIERIKMVQDLVSTGMNILLVGGDEWKAVLPNYENVIFANPCTHQKLIEYYMQSRAVASTNCFNGANERTFDAMSCGSISISENSPTLMKYFNDLKDIIFYERNNAELKSEIICDLLTDNLNSELVGENGREIFMRDHTWASRVNDLSILMSKIQF
jgi:hypothetical protein